MYARVQYGYEVARPNRRAMALTWTIYLMAVPITKHAADARPKAIARFGFAELDEITAAAPNSAKNRNESART
jgi:hypothetical protein